MDPVGAVTSLAGVIKYLWDAADKVQQNREECVRLAAHATDVLKLLEVEVQAGVPPDLLVRLQKLVKTFAGLNATLDELSRQPRLKKILWRHDVAGRIAEVYKGLSSAVELFNLGSKLDLRRFQQESEEARRVDADKLHASFQQVKQNDHEILQLLEIQKSQMQEAMMTLHRHFLTLENSLERQFLEKGMHAMQRRSGEMKTIPDAFLITSIDIVIHHDKKLGEGGFGQVYQADWQGITVAVKVIEKGITPLIFQKEIDIWKRLRHPNILEFFGACSIADPPFVVCALKSGGNAVCYLQTNPSANRYKLLFQASMGLKYLHQHSVIHGDLKASNVLIDEHGVACLSDFGLSKIKMHTTTARDLSNSTSLQGSPRWMSPEQMSLGVTNKMTDIYSFSMTIYEVFTGAPPFASTIDTFLFAAVVDRQLRPPRPTESSADVQDLDDNLWTLVQECWSHEPISRPNAASVATRLSDLSSLHTDETKLESSNASKSPDDTIQTPEASSANDLAPSLPPTAYSPTAYSPRHLGHLLTPTHHPLPPPLASHSLSPRHTRVFRPPSAPESLVVQPPLQPQPSPSSLPKFPLEPCPPSHLQSTDLIQPSPSSFQEPVYSVLRTDNSNRLHPVIKSIPLQTSSSVELFNYQPAFTKTFVGTPDKLSANDREAEVNVNRPLEDPTTSTSSLGIPTLSPEHHPASISELTERAQNTPWDPELGLEYWLNVFEAHHSDGDRFICDGDLEAGFVRLTTATLIVDRLPKHPEFMTELDPDQRDNLTEVSGVEIFSGILDWTSSDVFLRCPCRDGSLIMGKLASVKAELISRNDQWLRRRGIGTLIVVLLKAKHLPDKQLIGKQDPFCVLTINGESQRTKAIEKGGQDPEWDEEIRFVIRENAPPHPGSQESNDSATKIVGGHVMKLACFAKTSRDPDLIGETVVDLTEALTKGECDEWFTLHKDGKYCGEVYLELTFWLNVSAVITCLLHPNL